MKAACYCATRNIYGDLAPSVNSLLANSDVDKVYLLIEDDTFPYKLPQKVETRNVKEQTYFHRNGPNFNNSWTYMVLMRAALHREFPDLDRILSLDVDTIVAKDISELWELPIDDYWIAGAREPYKSQFYDLYINCGVMLMNLKKLREDGKGDELINALNTKRYSYNEQDAIADLCHGGIYELPSDYNANEYTKPTVTPKIIHFAAIQHWQDLPLVEMYK